MSNASKNALAVRQRNIKMISDEIGTRRGSWAVLKIVIRASSGTISPKATICLN